jgi:NAD+ kinase
MRISIFSKVAHQRDLPILQQLLTTLHRQGCQPYLYEPYHRDMAAFGVLGVEVGFFSDHLTLKQVKPDFMITLGGDGTILDAVVLIRQMPVPVLGINLGRLGFLAATNPSRIAEAITALKEGSYTISHRKLLQLESSLPIFGDAAFALNDFTVLKRDTSSMISIHTYINGDYLGTYWADGIIVATPTGSTGYSLSCGGPIIFPQADNFVITPVAPHNLNVRPLIVPDSSVISFEIEGRSDSFLCTLDSRFESITPEHQLAVRQGDFTVRMVQLYGENFSKTIREKLSWGRDNRN